MFIDLEKDRAIAAACLFATVTLLLESAKLFEALDARSNRRCRETSRVLSEISNLC